MTKIYGHRGSKGTYPENSLLAIKKSLDAGVEGIELDIHLTKDNEIVVIHDETLERTTTGTGFVKDYTYEQLREFQIGPKFKHFNLYEPSWDDERIPTLRQVMDLMRTYGEIELNIELKTAFFKYDGIEEKVLNEVKMSGYPGRVVYSSFHVPTIHRIKKIDPEAHIAMLWDGFIPHPTDYMAMLNLEALHLGQDFVTKHIDQYAPIAKHLRIWTVNEEQDMQTLLHAGVEAIITDFPEKAIDLRKNL